MFPTEAKHCCFSSPPVNPEFAVSPWLHFSLKPPAYSQRIIPFLAEVPKNFLTRGQKIFGTKYWLIRSFHCYVSICLQRPALNHKSRVMCAVTHMRRDVGFDLSQDVLAVHKLDSDGHQKRL